MTQKKLKKTITIQNELNVYNAKEHYNTIKKSIEEHDHIQLKLKDIRQLDITGIQIIRALKAIPGKRVDLQCSLEESLDKLLTQTSIRETLN